MKLILILFQSIIIISNSGSIQDLVDIRLIPELPQQYNHKWYSGYLAAYNSESSIYYNFFESQNNPKDDPVLLWLNGGPQCSSLFGLYNENGPFIFLPSSNQSIINKYSWNLNANVLYIESPSGVGFSETNNIYPNDTSTSLDSYAALIDFFTNKHPEFRQNEFYISGESYAGIYIPFLVNYISQTDTDHQINLKGFIIGNGCTLGNECTDVSEMVNYFSWHQLEQFNNHAFIGFEEWEYFTQRCNEQNFARISECSKQAASMVQRFSLNYVDINNLIGKCYHHIGEQLYTYKKYQLKRRINYLQSQFPTIEHFQKQKHNQLLDGVCDFEVGDFYLLNLDHVRQALHIKQSINELRWQTCSSMNYNENRNGSFFLYPKLLNLGLRIWIYSGDVDANVPITGTIKWLHKLKEEQELSEVEEWRPWFVVGERQGELQVGGMTWGLDKIRFASVRGAGHEVPFWEPIRALTLIQSFLKNEQLPSV